jgi:tetratricopeptide (TPR) repeat protein
MAGIGKTTLAVSWAHRVRSRFPDGQLYVDLRGFTPGGSVVSPDEAVRGFLDALAVAPQRVPAGLDAQVALYRSLLAGQRILVVLDNARDAEQVRPLLPGTPGCVAVVTSRNQLTPLIAAVGAQPLTLDLLTDAEAGDMLARRVGPDRVAAEPAATRQIIASCARLPLALAIAAARATSHPGFPMAALAAELAEAQARLDILTADEQSTDVRAVFSWSYRDLTAAAARLFRLLGLHPGPDISIPATASLAGLPADRVRPLLAELTRTNLIVEHAPGRYTFHDLLRAYAAEQAHDIEADDQRRAAVRRALDHYLHTAHAAAVLLDPHRDPITPGPPHPGTGPEHLADHEHALAWFTAEHPVLLATVDHAAGNELDSHALELAWTLTDFLYRQGHWHDLAVTQRAALAAARRLADTSAQARTHRFLAAAYTRLSRFSDARRHLRHALDLYRRAGDQIGQAHTYRSLSLLHGREGRHAAALDYSRQALDLYRAADHRDGQARALNGIGWCCAQLGDYQPALIACQQALTLYEELDDVAGQAATWDSLGYAHHHLSQHSMAITCYQRALDLFRLAGDRYQEAEVLTLLGDTHHTTGNTNAARTAWLHALTLLGELGHPDADQVRARLHRVDLSPEMHYRAGSIR